MKLSIIIPLYNKEKYIERCLESLSAQDISPRDYEVIIVDDESKDSGVEIAQNYANNNADVNIHLIKQQNQGPSAARNNGLKLAKGKYVYFLDADDYIALNTLNYLLKLCEKNNLDILEFDTSEIADGTEPSTELSSTPLNSQELAVPVVNGSTYIIKYNFRNQAWRYIIKRSFILDTEITFLEEMRAYEDLIFTVNLFLQSNRISKANINAHRYVRVPNSIVTTKNSKKNLEFLHSMVKAVSELSILINNLKTSEQNHLKLIGRLKNKQFVVVYALLVRAFKYGVNTKDLNTILIELNTLEAYPINPKVEGIGKGSLFHSLFFVPIFNNKTYCLFGLKIMNRLSFFK